MLQVSLTLLWWWAYLALNTPTAHAALLWQPDCIRLTLWRLNLPGVITRAFGAC